MKKTALILMIVTIIIFSVTGCGNNTPATANSTTEIPSSAESAEIDVIEAISSEELYEPQDSSVPVESAEIKKTTTVKKTEKKEADYSDLINTYTTALNEKWNGGKLMENELNYMMADCYGSDPLKNIGFAVKDLDGNGIDELIIGTTSSVTDDFYSKLIFEVYTLNSKGVCVKVLNSVERNRYYYAGGNNFANLGSNGANDSFETTVKLEGDELIDMTQTTEPSKYVQMKFTMTENK